MPINYLTVSVGQKSGLSLAGLLLRVSQGCYQGVDRAAFLPGGLSEENPLPGPCKVFTGFISSQLMTEGPGFLLAVGCPGI